MNQLKQCFPFIRFKTGKDTLFLFKHAGHYLLIDAFTIGGQTEYIGPMVSGLSFLLQQSTIVELINCAADLHFFHMCEVADFFGGDVLEHG